MKLQQPTYCQVLNPEDRCVEDEKEKQLRNDVKAFFFYKRRLFYFNFFQRVSKQPPKEVKASGGCHGNRKGVLCASTKPIPDAIMPRHN
ncbi:hypothetical protein ABH968_004356 [Lysinibacillus sp. RC79]